MKYVRETAAGKSLSAWVIMKGARHVATVQSHYSNGGTVTVNVWQEPEAYKRSHKAAGGTGDDRAAFNAMNLQHATAGGGGYDKTVAALSGLYIDGHKLTNHSGEQLKAPRGKGFFPRDFKAPRGYSLANYGEFDKATGQRRHSYHWTDKAQEQLGESAEWEAVKARADELRASAELESGYSSCYRQAGLRYLEEIGYSVISAI